MSAINFVTSNGAGAVQRGAALSGDSNNDIIVPGGRDISLNLSPSDLRSYSRSGADLQITLADGRVIVVEGYFAQTASGEAHRLFMSADGALNEVLLQDGGDGVLYANYSSAGNWGKWSPSDELIFVDRPDVALAGTPVADDEVSMFGAPLLGAGAGLGGLAAVGGAAVIGGLVGGGNGGGGNGGGGNGGGGNGGGGSVAPTVDTTPVVIGGDDARNGDPKITVTGTAVPGDVVTVVIGDQQVDTTTGDDGTWTVDFTGTKFPVDGGYQADVTVKTATGDVDLSGPQITIDLTPPVIDMVSGVVSTDDLFNAETHEDGVTLTGTGEAGATVDVTIRGVTHSTTVAADGTWSVDFTTTEVVAGEYIDTVTVVSRDSYGNSTTLTDQIDIDTVPNPITIDEDSVGGDGTVNMTERDGGISITGTSRAGATLTVTVFDVAHEVKADATGNWTVNLAAGDVPDGTYDVNVTATSVDRAGNSNTVTGDFHVDTENSISITAAPIAGDDVVNHAEADAGLTLTGQTDAGSTVSVTIGSVTHSATVAADGSWTVDFSGSDLPADGAATVTAVSTDAAGNTVSDSRDIVIDRVSEVTIDTDDFGGDAVVNAAEAAAGITLTGTTEPGSTVDVTFNGSTYTASVDASGVWTVPVAAANVPTGEASHDVTAVATDAAGNVATATGTVAVDTENSVSITAAPIAGDDVVNSAEANDGVTLTGQTDPGSSVDVTIGSVTHSATVAADGSWSVVFSDADLPADGAATVTAVSTDAAGNTATDSRDFNIDRAAEVTVDALAGVVNADDAAAGITLTGTTQPGSTVDVTFNGSTYTASVDASGVWTVPVAAANVPTGEASHDVTAVATDAAGNVATATGSVTVDTIAHVEITDDAVLYGDNIINADEKSEGITLTGSSEPGTTQVTVRFGSTEKSATVAADGTWSVDFTDAEIPADGTAMFSATAVDAAGNTSPVDTRSIEIDTAVVPLTAENPADSASGGIVSRTELDAGLVMNGTVEAGSSVTLSYAGETYVASVDASGNWSATLPASAFAGFEGNAPITVQATDVAGNTAEIIQTVAVDTVAPDGVETTGVAFRTGTRMVKDIDLDGDQSGASFARVEGDGTLTDLNLADSAKRFDGTETEIGFTPGTVSDGTHLVVTTEDSAGNASGTYLVVSSNTGSADIDLSNPALAGYEIETLDLSATKGSLTITEADLKALSTNSDTLTIHGDAADQVEIIGAVKGDSSEGYTSYTLGDATLLIDDDIVNAGGVAII